MKIVLFSALSSILFIAMLASCRQKPCQDPSNFDCENYDPCYGRKRVSAAFKIQETITDPQIPEFWGDFLDTDTVISYAVQFTALEEDAEYEWHIGSEVLTGKSVTKTNFPLGRTYPITLIVKKAPYSVCFPKDDGKDTLTRMMYMVDKKYRSPFLGTFKGLVTNPVDTLTIRIAEEQANIGGIIENVWIPYNWGCKNNDCHFENGAGGNFTYKKMYYSYPYVAENCLSPSGVFEIKGKANDTLIINYKELKVPFGKYEERVTRKFVGVRQ